MNEVKELKYGNTRCFCINGTVLVDTDWAGTLPLFYRCAKENGVDLKSVRYLIITHFHPDHMGIAQELADTGIRIVVFDEQRDYVHFSDRIFEKDKAVRFRPVDDSSVLYLTCAESREFLLHNGIAGEVISTIGHSNDSVSVLLDDGIAIVGDLYPLYSVPAYNDSVLEQSWNAILSRGIKCVHYAHAKSDYLSNINCVKDIL